MMKPKDFFDFAKTNKCEMIDLKFVDMLGTWQQQRLLSIDTLLLLPVLVVVIVVVVVVVVVDVAVV